MSIHKSQGQTLERVKVDLRRIFEKGLSCQLLRLSKKVFEIYIILQVRRTSRYLEQRPWTVYKFLVSILGRYACEPCDETSD